MGIRNIGEIINTLRKGKGVTQEELANYVGVSTQAVSKWECGGVPDTELIPIIADYFGVSTDTLFGRDVSDYGDLAKAIEKNITSGEYNERFKKGFELMWQVHQAVAGEILNTNLDEAANISNHAYSQIRSNNGISSFDLSNDAPYLFFIPESDKRSDWLLNDIDYVSFFKMLSEQDAFDALVLLYKKDKKSFTPNLFVKKLNITIERSQEIIDEFMKFAIIERTEIEVDDEVQYVYTLRYNPEFNGLLTFAHDMIKPPNSFYIYHGGREIPYI